MEMYIIYNCQYSLFNLLCICSYIVNVIYIQYIIIICIVVTNASGHSTILSRRYDIPFSYSDILFHDSKHIWIIICCLTELLSYWRCCWKFTSSIKCRNRVSVKRCKKQLRCYFIRHTSAKNTSAKNNYRPIAIVTAMSKIFELCLSTIMDAYLFTSDNQFGFNPIRSGLFQTVNDPGGGALKAPPYDLENYCVNLHHIIHVNFTRCFRHDPIGIF